MGWYVMFKSKKLNDFFKVLPIIICLTLVCLYFIFRKDITIESIISYTPNNSVLAILFIWFMYAIKSLSVFFPLSILKMVSGYLFSLPIAFMVNVIGLIISTSIPYWLGKFSGASAVDRLIQKYPKLESVVDLQYNNDIFVSFFLRVVRFLPGDIVSMYLGAINIPFPKYLLGSLLGLAPGIITSTLIGASITDPSSPMFIISIIMTVVISTVSALIYYIYKKKSHN